MCCQSMYYNRQLQRLHLADFNKDSMAVFVISRSRFSQYNHTCGARKQASTDDLLNRCNHTSDNGRVQIKCSCPPGRGICFRTSLTCVISSITWFIVDPSVKLHDLISLTRYPSYFTLSLINIAMASDRSAIIL